MTVLKLDPETGYLCDIARAWANGVQGPVPPSSALDKDRFIRMVSSIPAMQTLAPFIDPVILTDLENSQLQKSLQISHHRTIMMLLELERLVPALGEIGCRPVVLKGASLALTVYDKPEHRWFIDLDLLVERGEVEAVYEILGRLGYKHAQTAHPARYYDDYHFHRIMTGPQGVCVEVHWGITLPRSVYTYDLDQLRFAAVEIPLGEASFLGPSAMDQVLHGVLQSVAGGFYDLRRFLDLHLLDSRLDDSEHHLLCARALRHNLATGLWLQYHIREELLGAAMPPVINRLCRPGPSVVRILERLNGAAMCLSDQTRIPSGYAMLLHWLSVPSRYRTREVRRHLFPDSEGLLEAGLGVEGPVRPWEYCRLNMERMLQTARLMQRIVRG